MNYCKLFNWKRLGYSWITLVTFLLVFMIATTSCSDDKEDIIIDDPIENPEDKDDPEEEEPEEEEPEEEPELKLEIKSFSPEEGPSGTEVYISGSGLKNDSTDTEVYFNETKAEIVSGDENVINVKAPSLNVGTKAIISVIVGKDTLIASYEYTYIRSVIVSTIVGTPGNKGYADGEISSTLIGLPFNVTIDKNDNLFISTWMEGIMMVNQKAGTSKIKIQNERPIYYGGAADKNGEVIWFTNEQYLEGHSLLNRLDPANDWTVEAIELIFPTEEEIADGAIGVDKEIGVQQRQSMAISPTDGMIYNHTKQGLLLKIDPETKKIKVLREDFEPNNYGRLAIDPNNPDMLYISLTNSFYIGRYNIKTDVFEEYAGEKGTQGNSDGNIKSAKFNRVQDIAFDNNGDLIIADGGGNSIRKIDMKTEEVTTIAGTGLTDRERGHGHTDGTADIARFWKPNGVAIGSDNSIYVADYNNHCIRKITTIE